jgi:glycosyltransferase involved in cell wall biosynthesis
MKLSIIVPIYNEETNLLSFIEYLMNFQFPINREIIFVNDCSSDSSLKILTNLKEKYDFKLVSQIKHCGKGAAVIKGIDIASGSIIMIQDADFEYDLHDIPKLLAPIIENSADVVYGSRFKKNSMQVHRTYHYFVNRFLTFISNLLSGIYLTDMETCYKIFRTEILKSMKLKSQRFGIEIELTAYIAKTSFRIQELPIRYYPRSRMQGKKITWLDGVAAIYHLFYFNILITKKCAFKN